MSNTIADIDYSQQYSLTTGGLEKFVTPIHHLSRFVGEIITTKWDNSVSAQPAVGEIKTGFATEYQAANWLVDRG